MYEEMSSKKLMCPNLEVYIEKSVILLLLLTKVHTNWLSFSPLSSENLKFGQEVDIYC